MGRSVFIHGRGNKVPGNVNDIALINCIDYEVTESDEGRTILNSGALVVDENGLSTATIALTQAIKTADFTAGASAYNVYFVDCTGGNVDVSIEHSQRPLYIFKTDISANVVNLIPTSGFINGLASVSITAQYESATIFSDGTAMYTVSGGGSGTSNTGTGGVIDAGNRIDQGEINLGTRL